MCVRFINQIHMGLIDLPNLHRLIIFPYTKRRIKNIASYVYLLPTYHISITTEFCIIFICLFLLKKIGLSNYLFYLHLLVCFTTF